tara:strand:+ start:5417 stop:5581 length:165 start_codon:yes stop_codon:yes gene_type:complete
VSIALLTIYDMRKAADKAMIIEDIKLLQKRKIDHLRVAPIVNNLLSNVFIFLPD